MPIRAKIAGTGSYLPPRIVKNDDLKELFETSDEWIFTRTGIHERRYAEAGVYCSDLALEASRIALEDACMQPEDLECIVFATLSPDIHFPGSAVFLQDKLGIADRFCACYDIRQQCSGYIYGTEMAKAFIEAGLYRNVLLVGAEVHSSALDFSDRGRMVSVLFGDGASATVFQPFETDREDDGVFHTQVHADGRGALNGVHMKIWDISHKPFVDYDVLDFQKNQDIWPQMPNPRALFTNGVIRMAEVTVQALEKNGLSVEDLDWMLPHQANIHINYGAADRMKLPREKVLMNIHKYGNTTAATIPLLLDEHVRNQTIRKGHLLALVSFGSGFTWGSALVRY